MKTTANIFNKDKKSALAYNDCRNFEIRTTFYKQIMIKLGRGLLI